VDIVYHIAAGFSSRKEKNVKKWVDGSELEVGVTGIEPAA